jgi:hypothetical protein
MSRRLATILLIAATLVVLGLSILAHAWTITGVVLVAFVVWHSQTLRSRR